MEAVEGVLDSNKKNYQNSSYGLQCSVEAVEDVLNNSKKTSKEYVNNTVIQSLGTNGICGYSGRLFQQPLNVEG